MRKYRLSAISLQNDEQLNGFELNFHRIQKPAYNYIVICVAVA